jgi:hypothetical protein
LVSDAAASTVRELLSGALVADEVLAAAIDVTFVCDPWRLDLLDSQAEAEAATPIAASTATARLAASRFST